MGQKGLSGLVLMHVHYGMELDLMKSLLGNIHKELYSHSGSVAILELIMEQKLY